jgi:hypothetical protein
VQTIRVPPLFPGNSNKSVPHCCVAPSYSGGVPRLNHPLSGSAPAPVAVTRGPTDTCYRAAERIQCSCRCSCVGFPAGARCERRSRADGGAAGRPGARTFSPIGNTGDKYLRTIVRMRGKGVRPSNRTPQKYKSGAYSGSRSRMRRPVTQHPSRTDRGKGEWRVGPLRVWSRVSQHRPAASNAE